MIVAQVKNIYAYRELLFALTYRDIRVKYKQAVMGMLWAFFMPVLAVASGIFFRLVISHFSGEPLAISEIVNVMVKTVPWLLFAGIVGGASNSLIGNMGLITKIYFPRQVVPLSSLLSSVFDFAISLVGLIMILTTIWLCGLGGKPPIVLSATLLWVPVLLALVILMAAGLGLGLSCANLFLRDVKYIVRVLLQYGLFFSLVYFSHEELGDWGWMLLFNPIAPLLEGISYAMTAPQDFHTMLPWIGYSAGVTLVVLVVSNFYFEKAESLFSEYA